MEPWNKPYKEVLRSVKKYYKEKKKAEESEIILRNLEEIGLISPGEEYPLLDKLDKLSRFDLLNTYHSLNLSIKC